MKKYKILVVDDDHQLADLVKMNLPQSEFSAKACYNGNEALKEIEMDRPDLLVLDGVMPVIDRWEV